MFRKKIAPAVALGISFGALVSAESPDRFEDAAHIPPAACKEEIISALGADALSAAIKVDIENSEIADSPTNAENNATVDSDLLEGYPLLADVIRYPELVTERYITPESEMTINITRISNDYVFSPENFDFILRSTYLTTFEDDPLRTATYGCYEREIFDNKALSGHEIDVYLIGNGELCLGRKKVVPRGNIPDLCTAWGRRRSDGVYVLSPNSLMASRTILHEIGGHEAQKAIKASPRDDKDFEYFAEGVHTEATRIMRETGRLILYLEPTES